jgi:hypothetical protein
VCALLATYGGNEFIRSSSPLRQGCPPGHPSMELSPHCVMIM